MKTHKITISNHTLRRLLIGILAGILAGIGATAFLYALHWATTIREAHPLFILGLPIAGLAIGLIYHHFGEHEGKGFNLVLEEIHDPKRTVPMRMAPFVFIGSVLTHLVGGSAGREGAIVQTGAALSDQLSKVFTLSFAERKTLLLAGAGAGFGAGIGVPFAGAIFGMEAIHVGKLKGLAWLECFLASMTGYAVTLFAHAPHSHYEKLMAVQYDMHGLWVVIVLGCLSGFLATAFSHLTHDIQKRFQKIAYPPLRPFIGGILLLAIFYWEGTGRFTGLSLDGIRDSMNTPSDIRTPFLKGFFTILTVGSGFKGGEFVPLVFMGATLGSALSVIFKVNTQLLAAVGFSAIFAGASNTPIACTLMAIEIFGPRIGLYAGIACFLSYYCSSPTGIYAAQRVLHSKHHQIHTAWNWIKKVMRPNS